MRPYWLFLATAIGACAGPEFRAIEDAALVADSSGENWLAFGRTLNEQRFSPLRQIDASNVANLKVDWFIDLPDKSGLVSTPLVSNGVLYFIGSMNVVRVVDATSGRQIWLYDPHVAERADRMRAGFNHSRGIALWRDKVILATWDGSTHCRGRSDWARAVEHDDGRLDQGALHLRRTKGLQGQGDHRQWRNGERRDTRVRDRVLRRDG